MVVGREAIGHLRAQEGPEEGGMLLMLATASVFVLSTLCGLKLDLSVSLFRLAHILPAMSMTQDILGQCTMEGQVHA